MFYTYKINIRTANTITAPIRKDIDLIAGVIHQVDALFEDGCKNEAKIQIFHSNTQLWPTNAFNPDGTVAALTGDATVISFREFYVIPPGATDLRLVAWGDGVIDDVDIILQIGLLPKRVLQPLSFEELLAAATGAS